MRQQQQQFAGRKTSDITSQSSGTKMEYRGQRFQSDSERLQRRQVQHSHSVVSSTHSANNTSTTHEDTIILIPGVNIRLNYFSSNTSDKKPTLNTDSSSDHSTEFLDAVSGADSSSSTPKANQKAAGLNAIISVQPLPREMILKPSLLDFLEEALEPIVAPLSEDTSDNGSQALSADEHSTPEAGSILSSSGSELYSFPVNVIVFIRIEPSDIRISCSPVSKVECLLRIPCLDFSITSSPQPKSLSQKPLSTSSPKKKPTLNKKTSSNVSNASSKSAKEQVSPKGGFSCTVCLSRFSFCIFHPYGKQTEPRNFNDSGGIFGIKKREWSGNQQLSGRKDSLSLNVEFIKFNLFRQRTKVQGSPLPGKRKGYDSSENKTSVKVSGKSALPILVHLDFSLVLG